MSNETIMTPDAIKILEAKIKAFNKQWQEYNQNWTNISKITVSAGESYNQYGVTLTFEANDTIKYNNNIIVERKKEATEEKDKL